MVTREANNHTERIVYNQQKGLAKLTWRSPCWPLEYVADTDKKCFVLMCRADFSGV